MTHYSFSPRRAAQLFALLFCFAALGFPLHAQSNKGTIVGTITDPNDALVAAAKVTVTNIATNETREATSNEDGTYNVTNLDPGIYKVTIEAAGFRTVVRERVTVETNARLPVDTKLELGVAGGEVVTVTSDAPLVESESSVRGDLITGREVTDLPIPQRNFTLLAALSPGVTRPAVGVLGGGGNFVNGGPGSSTESTRFRESGGSVLAVNGARPTNNNFTLDGVDNNESQFGQIATYPPPDAIAEFKIETSVPSAESGRAGGAIVSTTFKSGGNDVHGNVFEFYQGRFGSAAASQFDINNSPPDPRTGIRRTPPNYVTHNFGGVVGGPIFLPRFGEGGPRVYNGRNRSFFFVSYAGQRNGTPAFGGGEFQFVTVPSARMRAGDFGELLQPGTSQTFNLAGGGSIVAPVGTVFCANATPAPANDVRRCNQPLSNFGQNFLNAYPLPTETGLDNNFRRNRAEKSNQDQYDIKIDHRFTENNSFFARYSRGEQVRIRDNNFPLGSSPNGNDLPSGFGAGEEFGNSRGITLGDTHMFTPTVINDARAGYNRVEIGINNPAIGGALGFNPSISSALGARNINICGTCEGALLLGVSDRSPGQLEFVGDGGPFYFVSNNFNFADAVTVVRGTQTMKFGGDIRVRQNSNFDGGRNGGIKSQVQYGTSAGGFLSGNFSGIGPDDSGSAIANLLLGYRPAFVSRGTPGGPYLQSSKEIAFFAQDDWKVRSDLTLNIGLRYDVFTQPTERFDRQVNFDPVSGRLFRAGDGAPGGRDLAETDRNNFGPRIGFAYSGLRDDKKLVLRGGYGLLYATDVSGQQPLTTNPGTGANNFSCNPSNNPGGCPQGGNFNLDTGIPSVSDVIAVQPGQSFAPPGGASLLYIDPNVRNAMFHQYNLTLQYEFATNWLAEVAYVANKGRNLLVVRNIGSDNGGIPGSRQVGDRNTVTATEYNGYSNYDSMQTKLEKRFSRGLSILSTYTWSHALDNSPGGFCLGGTGPSTCGFANPLRPELDYGNSDLDLRHRFTFANVYDLPFGRGRRFGNDLPSALDFFVGGFQLNNIITIQSGPPYSVGVGGRRADLIGDPTPTEAQRARGLEFNPAAFRAPRTPVFANDPTGPTFGTLGRNVFRGERQEYWDASLFKNFAVPSISEAFNVQFRLQVFNVLNHVNRYRPRTSLDDSLVGIDTNEQRRRQLEFSLKVLF